MVIFSRQETKTKQRNNQTKIDHKDCISRLKTKGELERIGQLFQDALSSVE